MRISDLEEIGDNAYMTHDGSFIIYQLENKFDWVVKDKRNSVTIPESNTIGYKGYIVKSIYDALNKMDELIQFA